MKIQKAIASLVIVGALLVPFVSRAQTADELNQRLIATLMELVRQLQGDLKVMLANQSKTLSEQGKKITKIEKKMDKEKGSGLDKTDNNISFATVPEEEESEESGDPITVEYQGNVGGEGQYSGGSGGFDLTISVIVKGGDIFFDANDFEYEVRSDDGSLIDERFVTDSKLSCKGSNYPVFYKDNGLCRLTDRNKLSKDKKNVKSSVGFGVWVGPSGTQGPFPMPGYYFMTAKSVSYHERTPDGPLKKIEFSGSPYTGSLYIGPVSEQVVQ